MPQACVCVCVCVCERTGRASTPSPVRLEISSRHSADERMCEPELSWLWRVVVCMCRNTGKFLLREWRLLQHDGSVWEASKHASAIRPCHVRTRLLVLHALANCDISSYPVAFTTYRAVISNLKKNCANWREGAGTLAMACCWQATTTLVTRRSEAKSRSESTHRNLAGQAMEPFPLRFNRCLCILVAW